MLHFFSFLFCLCLCFPKCSVVPLYMCVDKPVNMCFICLCLIYLWRVFNKSNACVVKVVKIQPGHWALCASDTVQSHGSTVGAADYQRMSRCFLFVGSTEPRGRSSADPETQRQWDVSVVVCGSRREELSPAQTEPTNAISVSNTIVLFSRANAPWPQSQTFGPTLRLIFDVDKTHTIALSPMWPGRGGGTTHCCFSLNWPAQPQ